MARDVYQSEVYREVSREWKGWVSSRAGFVTKDGEVRTEGNHLVGRVESDGKVYDSGWVQVGIVDGSTAVRFSRPPLRLPAAISMPGLRDIIDSTQRSLRGQDLAEVFTVKSNGEVYDRQGIKVGYITPVTDMTLMGAAAILLLNFK